MPSKTARGNRGRAGRSLNLRLKISEGDKVGEIYLFDGESNENMVLYLD